MHPLDNFENFLSNWIDELHEPDDKNKGGYTGSKCPFAKKAKVKTVKVYDYINPYVQAYYQHENKDRNFFDTNDPLYEVKKLKPNLEIYTPDSNQELIKLINEKTIEKDLILIMGAGDINLICATLFLEVINNKSVKSDLAA